MTTPRPAPASTPLDPPPPPALSDLDAANLSARIAYARSLQADIERFKARFPPEASPSATRGQTPMPAFTWEQAERQLTHLAAERRTVIPHRISAMRRLAPYQPAEMVLQQVLVEAWILLSQSCPAFGEEAAMS